VWPVITINGAELPPRTPPPPIQPIPFAEWPRYAKRLARRAVPTDRGIGDVVQRLAAKVGGERFKRIYKKITGKKCGCTDRQKRLNELYPLPN
jgi:hypothetical protein